MHQKKSRFQFLPKSLEYLTQSKTIKFKDKNLKTDYLINIINELIIKSRFFTCDMEFNLWSIILKQKYGKHYNYYIDWLVEQKTIKMISNYYSGKKARTYKLTIPEFDKKYSIIRCRIYDKILINKTKREFLNRTITQRANSPIPEDIRELLANDLNSIKIDYKKAMMYLENEYNAKNIDQRKYFKNTYSIESINDHHIFFKFDQYGRMHTNFTNLKKEIKVQFLTIDGDRLSEVDIINSQPLFFAKMLEDEIGEKNLNREVKRFIALTKNGLIYDDFVNKSPSLETRKEAKILFYKVLFGYNNDSETDKIFKSFYPTVYEYIKEYKSIGKSYKQFSHILQRMESKFIFNTLVRKLKNIYPHIKLFTIHDSICFPEKYKTEVNLVFNNCFKEYFSISW